MKTCINCESRAPKVTPFILGGVEIGNCIECGRLIRATCTDKIVGALSELSTQADTGTGAAGGLASDQDAISQIPVIYLVLSKNSVVDTIEEELADVAGARFKIFADPAEAMTVFVQDTRLEHARKLVIFHSANTDAEGTPFVYAVRAVEMGFGSTQVPILVLGDSATPMLERCIQESKNARFVSIGHPSNDVELVKRYLKVIDKLAKR